MDANGPVVHKSSTGAARSSRWCSWRPITGRFNFRLARLQNSSMRHANSSAGEPINAVEGTVATLAVAPERRYMFAGLGDRMSTFGQAHRLWLHWDRPTLAA
ncbi:MAG: hypothetical protein ACLQPH_04435 [Acidimicrobiales bacterium]